MILGKEGVSTSFISRGFYDALSQFLNQSTGSLRQVHMVLIKDNAYRAVATSLAQICSSSGGHVLIYGHNLQLPPGLQVNMKAGEMQWRTSNFFWEANEFQPDFLPHSNE